jgi:hypothetical protein
MARFEKNAAGEDVDVSGPEFGCITIKAAAPEPAPKTKARPAAGEPEAAEEGTAS